MSILQKFEKPLGMRDTLPKLFEQLNKIRTQAMKYVTSNGYEFIQTPSLEYFETIGKISALDESVLFKLVDNQGEMLVLRPDLTTPIARVAASKLLKEKNPLRLAYSSTVFRAQQQEGGRPAEFEQFGLELLGDSSAIADSEVLRLAAGLVKKLGVKDFQLTVGHSAFIDLVIQTLIQHPDDQSLIRTHLIERNFAAIDNWAKQNPDADTFMKFLQFAIQGSSLQEIVDAFPELNSTVAEQFIQLIETLEQLDELKGHLQIDPLLISHMHYYTGVVFEIYASGSGFPLGNGGRYDGLIREFGAEAGATGFSLRMDRLVEILPAADSDQIKRLIYVEPESYVAGLQKASVYREQGEAVTLQVKSEVRNLSQFEQGFDTIMDWSKGVE